MAAQPAPLSLQEFHALYDGAKPAYEYWCGAAIQKAMPTALHSLVQKFLIILLEGAGWNTAPELRLKIIAEAEPVPDLIAIRGVFEELYPTTAPALCIEILSPGDRLAKALEKAGKYLSWGTECVWIIDPRRRTAWQVAQGTAADPAWIAPDGALRIGDTTIEMETLFAEVDRRLKLSPKDE